MNLMGCRGATNPSYELYAVLLMGSAVREPILLVVSPFVAVPDVCVAPVGIVFAESDVAVER